MITRLMNNQLITHTAYSIHTLRSMLPILHRRCWNSIRCYNSSGSSSSGSVSASHSLSRTTTTAASAAVVGSGGALTTPSPSRSSSLFTGRPTVRYWPISLSNSSSGTDGEIKSTRSLHHNHATITAINPHTRQFSSVISQQVSEYARQSQTNFTLQELLAVGPNPSKEALLVSARFLHRELPIRLAKRVKELESLPYGLSQMPPVLKVRSV
jgi:hypothetical protein